MAVEVAVMPGRVVCKSCGIQRAKPGEEECNVCWLLRTLRDEHRQGEHMGGPNASCSLCQPDLNKRLLEICRRDASDRIKEPKEDDVQPRGTTPRKIAREARTDRSDSRHAPMSHKDCDHESTPRARARCRAERAKVNR